MFGTLLPDPRHPSGLGELCALAILGALLFATPASAGFNNDGNVDAIFANYDQPPSVCLGDGAGGFSCSDVSTTSNRLANKVALGDVNGDGHVDAVFAIEWQSLFTVCLGDGDGGFACRDNGTDWNHFLGVALGDVNGDGSLDAVFANYGLPDQVCLGNGAGGFACSDVSSDTFETYAAALADLDSDGDLDAVFANRVGNDRVCLGDGTGRFSCRDVKADPVDLRSFDVKLGDLNGDGSLDAVFSDCSAPPRPHRVCLGDGAGGFSSCGDISPSYGWTYIGCSYGTALGDFNGDGNLDAVFSNQGEKNPVCLGDGTGRFTCSDVRPESTNDHDVAVSDVNGDGALDAVFASYDGSETCLGDGAGAFACSVLTTSARNSRGVALYPDNTVTPEPAELTVTKAYLRFAKDDAPEDSEAQQAYADIGGPQCPGEDKDLLRVRGTMDLAEDSDGIDPLSEAVTLSAGIHSVQVPAGSFRWWSKEDAYGYAGDYNGGRVWILLRELSAYEDLWEFRAGLKGIDNSGMSNPMAVKLSIGDDRGQTEVKLFGSLRYVAP